MSNAPIFVIGCAIFSIFWGAVAGLLVRSINLDDHSSIEECIKTYQKDDAWYERNK